jgi:hypothetical protein
MANGNGFGFGFGLVWLRVLVGIPWGSWDIQRAKDPMIPM